MRYVVTVEGKAHLIEIEDEGKITVDDQVHAVDIRRINPPGLYSLLIDNVSYQVFVQAREGQHYVGLGGRFYTVQTQEERPAPCPAPAAAGGEVVLEAPMPGLVVEVLATVGQANQAGDVLIVLESMKMRVDLRCPQDGVVEAIHVAAQDHVSLGQALVTLST